MSQNNIPVAHTIADLPPRDDIQVASLVHGENLYPVANQTRTTVVPIAETQYANNNSSIHQYPVIAQAFPYMENDPNRIWSTSIPQQIPEEFYSLVLCRKLSKTIRFFSAIDIFFCFLYLFTNPYISLFATLPILGFYGAKEYNVAKLYAYSMFICLLIVGRCVALGYNFTRWNTFFTFISVFIEFWILRLVCTFISTIKKIPPEQILGLRELH